jgi:hypothetical protein
MMRPSRSNVPIDRQGVPGGAFFQFFEKKHKDFLALVNHHSSDVHSLYLFLSTARIRENCRSYSSVKGVHCYRLVFGRMIIWVSSSPFDTTPFHCHNSDGVIIRPRLPLILY